MDRRWRATPSRLAMWGVALVVCAAALPLAAGARPPSVAREATSFQPIAVTSASRAPGVTAPPQAATEIDRGSPVMAGDLLLRSAAFPDPTPSPAPVAVAATAPPPEAACPSKEARPAPRGALAAFLGDSYTTGWTGSGIGRRGWPALVGASMGWRVSNRAVAGTGFVNPGWTGQPVRTRLASVIALRPAIVFLVAGHNDRRYAPGIVAGAADRVIDRLRRALPAATLVVIGPIWQDGSPARSIVALRDHLRRKAAAAGALFIDPLAGRWFAGASHRFIKADGIHPDDAGHRFIADRVLAALAALTRPAEPAAGCD